MDLEAAHFLAARFPVLRKIMANFPALWSLRVSNVTTILPSFNGSFERPALLIQLSDAKFVNYFPICSTHEYLFPCVTVYYRKKSVTLR